jgi:hypothetical protein
MKTPKARKKKIDTIEKLAALVVEGFEEMRVDITKLGGRLSAVEDRLTAVESKIAGLHRRIDMELDQRKQHDVRLTRIERHVKLSEAA